MFTLKVPGKITHEDLIGNTNAACSEIYQFEKTHLEPIKEAGKLGAVLIQLPPFFKEEHTDKLTQLLSSFSTPEYRVFVEVRQKELYSSSELEDTIINEGASMVSVDSPASHLDTNFHTSGSMKYIRLHGRNNMAWWIRNSDRNARYDYEYSNAELREIKDTVLSGTKAGDEIFIYFNNHPSGKAPRNAGTLLQLLGFKTGISRQKTLL